MRIATWNCQGGFDRKIDQALSLGADVLVVQECASPERWRDVLPEGHCVWWTAEGPHKGLAVITAAGYSVGPHPAAQREPAFRHVHPVSVTAPDGDLLTVFAVWTLPAPRRVDSYIGQVWQALDAYEELIGERTILTGDFNSHPRWDAERLHNHSAVCDRLGGLGVRSAYHVNEGCAAGEEPHSTQYLYRHVDRPYHLDYLFASADLLQILTNVEVGTHSEWGEYSDHMPLIADFRSTLDPR